MGESVNEKFDKGLPADLSCVWSEQARLRQAAHTGVHLGGAQEVRFVELSALTVEGESAFACQYITGTLPFTLNSCFLARMRCFFTLCTLALLPLQAFSEGPSEGPFDYDRPAGFPVTLHSTESRGAAELAELEYQSGADTVRASIVRPAKGGKRMAGILYVHWLGDHQTSNRTQFQSEALELAERGVVSVLIDAPWSRLNWYKDRVPEEDYAHSVQQVIAQRRAMDLLLNQPGVDASRIAVVAHDFGAMYSMLAEAYDRRAKTYVFMAPTPHFADWFFFARQPVNPEAYKAQLAGIDPVRFVGRLSPAPILFQFAAHDFYVSAEAVTEFSAAVHGPKEVRTYDTEHHLRVPQARADRMAWVIRELGL